MKRDKIFSVKVLGLLMVTTAFLTGCSYNSRTFEQKKAFYEKMSPEDLEQVPEDKLEDVCYNYIRFNESIGNFDTNRTSFKRKEILVDKIYKAKYSHGNVSIEKRKESFNLLAQADHALNEQLQYAKKLRTSIGRCYGVSIWGDSFARKYEREINGIEEGRLETSETRAKLIELFKKFDEETENTKKWRIQNSEYLNYKDDTVEIKIVDIKINELYSSKYSNINMEVKNISATKILYPVNRKVWGYEYHPDLGGNYPIGAQLMDDCNNSFKLTKFEPEYYGRQSSIRPSEVTEFTLEFSGYPVDNAKTVVLTFDNGVFGQRDTMKFILPIKVFYKK